MPPLAMSQPQPGSSRLAALALGATLALAGFVVGHWLAETARVPLDPGGESLQDSRALSDSIQSLDVRLARIESSLSIQASRGDRNPEPIHALAPAAASSSSEGSASASAAMQDVQRELQLIEQRLDLITRQLESEHRVHFEVPTLAQVRSARRDVDWSFLSRVAEAGIDDSEAGTKLMRLMTFDDVLTRVGVPDVLWPDNPWWDYQRPANTQGRWHLVRLVFVGDCVSRVEVARMPR